MLGGEEKDQMILGIRILAFHKAGRVGILHFWNSRLSEGGEVQVLTARELVVVMEEVEVEQRGVIMGGGEK